MAATAFNQSARNRWLNSFSVFTAMFAAQFITNRLMRQRAPMRLAASERCEQDRLQQIQLRLLCFGHHFGGLSTRGLRLRSCAAGAFQVDENFFGAIKDLLWPPGKTRDF